MKTTLILLKLTTILLLFSCKSKTIDGYWKAESPTFSKAMKISKNGDLYNTTQIISDFRVVKKNNLTLSNNRLLTDYGDYEYIQANDIILDKSLSNAIAFRRISEHDWLLEDSIATAILIERQFRPQYKEPVSASVASSTKNKIEGVVQSIMPSGNRFIEVVVKTADGQIKNIIVPLTNSKLHSEQIKVGVTISAVGQWMDDEEDAFEPSEINIQ